MVGHVSTVTSPPAASDSNLTFLLHTGCTTSLSLVSVSLVSKVPGAMNLISMQKAYTWAHSLSGFFSFGCGIFYFSNFRIYLF